ncbi:MAG: NAD-dependent epimerase/dehydratase family protein [Candidatus Accumulibacter sp.]|nr:NAD-dependent epimerase/dehydratase family protein [Accumulibacter sp.]MCB1966463.1 NAD-dependent epimerase/dehydratase family protein [Accumulibacter sp.]
MILVSGASGFIGRHLIERLAVEGASVRCLSRHPAPAPAAVAADLSDRPALAAACRGVEVVFHCAGHAHAFGSLTADEAAMHWRINCEGTRNLVEAAGDAGVRCFVFLSSVKALAEPGECCVDEDFPGPPATAYGQAKLAAEQVVLEAGRRYRMHVVNLRLAMVYGFGGRGNLERMSRLVERGWFPPLPETGNHRSLVHVDDVVAAMRLVADDRRASGRTYIVAAYEAPSGRALFNALRSALGMRRCSWEVSELLLRLAAGAGDGLAAVTKRRMPFDTEVLDRLLGSAWYSPARIERELGWRTRVTLADGLAEMLGRAI